MRRLSRYRQPDGCFGRQLVWGVLIIFGGNVRTHMPPNAMLIEIRYRPISPLLQAA